MESYLYNDLYELEEKHWWHQAKRALVSEALARFVEPKVSSKTKPTLLDVGCGTGKNLEFFGERFETYGVDLFADAIAFCRKRGLTRLKQAPVEKLPYPDNTFDVVTALDVLEHVDDVTAAGEIYRVLKPGGVLIVTVPAYKWLWSTWDDVLHHQRRYTKGLLKETLEKKNFTLDFLSYAFSFLVVPAFVVRRVKQLLSPKEYGSDFTLSSPFINNLMGVLTKLERWWLWRFGVPTGTSVFAVAKKSVKVKA